MNEFKKMNEKPHEEEGACLIYSPEGEWAGVALCIDGEWRWLSGPKAWDLNTPPSEGGLGCSNYLWTPVPEGPR